MKFHQKRIHDDEWNTLHMILSVVDNHMPTHWVEVDLLYGTDRHWNYTKRKWKWKGYVYVVLS
jgi:hypothetical protein